MCLARDAHATGEAARAVQDPLSLKHRFAIQQEVSSFDVDQGKGSRYTIAARADYAPIPPMSLRLRVPIHHVWLSTGEQRTGVGDGELRLKGRIYEHGGYILVQAGVIQTLPIGSRTERLGNGATVVTPFITGGYKIGKTILYGYVSDAVAIRRDNQKRYEDLTDPSRDHETRCAIGLIHVFSDVVQMNLSMSAITILTRQDLGQTFLHGGPLLAFAPTDTIHIAVGAQLPLAGEKRFDWRGTLDAYLSF